MLTDRENYAGSRKRVSTRMVQERSEKQISPSIVHTRRVQACLVVTLGYLLLVLLAVGLRLEAHLHGLLLSKYALPALRHVLVFHGVGALLILLALLTVHVFEVKQVLVSKLALLAMSIVFLAGPARGRRVRAVSRRHGVVHSAPEARVDIPARLDRRRHAHLLSH